MRRALTGLAITAPLVLPQPHQRNSSAAADVTLHVVLDLVSGGARLQSLSPGQRWALQIIIAVRSVMPVVGSGLYRHQSWMPDGDTPCSTDMLFCHIECVPSHVLVEQGTGMH